MKVSIINSVLTRVVSSDENPNLDIIRLSNYKAEVSSYSYREL